MIFDIDNTLVEHDAPCDERAARLMEKLKELGYSICFLSNNDEKRVADFNVRAPKTDTKTDIKPDRGPRPDKPKKPRRKPQGPKQGPSQQPPQQNNNKNPE